MLFDPEDGMTLEQSIEIAWNKHVTPAMRARVLALAEQLGWTRNEVILECRRKFLEDLEDPAKRQAWHEEIDRELQPFGPDPLVRKNR